MFISIAGSSRRVFNTYAMTMFMLQKVACYKNISRQKYDIGDIRGICDKARYTGSWMAFGTLPLDEVKLSSQILAVVGKRMRF